LKKGKTLFTVLIILSLSALYTPVRYMADLNSNGKYSYVMTVDDEGKLKVEIFYYSNLRKGSSWVLVPKNFTEWKLEVLEGEIESSEIKDAYTKTGEKYVFYYNFTYNFTSSNSFKIKITYEMDYGSIIVEPQCLFFSPQIGFNPQDSCIVHIFFPKTAVLDADVMYPQPAGIEEQPNAYEVTFYLQDNMARIAIEYTTINPPDIVKIKRGIYTVETPKRYLNLAERLINAYETVYNNLTRIFSTNLTSVYVKFYAPSLEDLWIGGFIPFNGTHLSEINLNLFFIRTSPGYWEQIAIHELIHHFVWAAGISPNLLWFHEGLAEYISFELTLGAGWTGAEDRRERLEIIAEALKQEYGFIQDWRPGKLSGNIIMYYAAAYSVVKELAQSYGGLEFYRKFFSQIKGFKNITSTDTLVYYLSKCAEEDLTPKFIQWRFNVVNIYAVHEAIQEGKDAVARQLPIAQPWATVARKLIEQAEDAIRRGDLKEALMKAIIGGFIAKISLTLTILTVGAVVLLIMRRLICEEI